MSAITLEDLRTWYRVQKGLATDRVTEYALTQCPLVPLAEVDVVCGALGDVSVNEAHDVLDRRQRELAGRAIPGE